MNQDELLKLDNQLCFPLYVASKEIVRKYKPFLDKVGLTYTQYIVFLVLWEKDNITLKELGERLYLDSGTLTPLLKQLESRKLITRKRGKKDEREVFVKLTTQGQELKDKVINIPSNVGKCVKLDSEEAKLLYKILYKIIAGFED